MNKDIVLKNIKKRWALSKSQKISYDHDIYKKVMELISKLSTNKYIMIYWPIENEVDTIAIIHELLLKNHLVCIPYISNDNVVSFKKITTIHFNYGWFKNIKIPLEGQVVPIKNISLMIFPVVVFNNKNEYMNYSIKSFFDEIAKYENQILKIGLAYDFQKNNLFKFESNKLDKIITN